ncbi:hypothetical protein DNK34_24100 [Pseudomonas dryadis]|uniref:YD repeat-containing protein n=1 Tax=Phytopseudomonas dryadis TaxID=2487520 RepID=A0ABY1Z1P5_9GAMM|nr:hypothetical protein DNK34_24100 [Pseudomonas dryadis]TBV12667.1 hypothetical protein DNK41_24135 [Pseudomonas sp. FRB 230]
MRWSRWPAHYDVYGITFRTKPRTEASGTEQARTITTEWHPSLFLPLTVTEPDRITHYQYDDQGRPLSRTVETR